MCNFLMLNFDTNGTPYEGLRRFKNRGEAEVFKHKDLRAWSLIYSENGDVFILQRRQSNCGFYKLFVMIINEIYLIFQSDEQ